jgi:hypothetical protein
LDRCDVVLYLDNGVVKAVGSSADLKAEGYDFQVISSNFIVNYLFNILHQSLMETLSESPEEKEIKENIPDIEDILIEEKKSVAEGILVHQTYMKLILIKGKLIFLRQM